MAIDAKSVRPLERFMIIYYIYKLENVVCDADCTNIWCKMNAKIAYVGMGTAVRPLQHFSAASNTGFLSHQLKASRVEIFLEVVGLAELQIADSQDFKDSGEDVPVVPTDLSSERRSTSMCDLRTYMTHGGSNIVRCGTYSNTAMKKSTTQFSVSRLRSGAIRLDLHWPSMLVRR